VSRHEMIEGLKEKALGFDIVRVGKKICFVKRPEGKEGDKNNGKS